ncbi:hypothetical protein BC830DRAFT_1128686 [Chytriomyces sp. MP71]|nr:hypothetical protein BC830DRAFT_1128686 [Chytriomyces sp. MP71]
MAAVSGKELQHRIDMERMCQEGARSVLGSLRDETQIAQCRKTIADSTARLNALEAELQRVNIAASPVAVPQPLLMSNGLPFMPSAAPTPTPPVRSASRSYSLPRPLSSSQPSLFIETRKSASNDSHISPSTSHFHASSYDAVDNNANSTTHSERQKMLRVASQKMGNAVDKVFTSFNRSLSLLSIRSSFTNLLGSGGPGVGSSAHGALNGPDLTSVQVALCDFDYLRCEVPASQEKVAYKLSLIESKLKIEEKVQAGTERMWEVILKVPSSDEKRAKLVEEKLLECRDKVAILKKSLERYQTLLISEKDLPPLPPDAEMDEPLTLDTETAIPTPSKSGNTRHPMSGRLRVTLVGATGASTTKPARPETYAILRIDGTEKTKTRASRSKWMDDIDIHVEKGGEVEIAIYEKGAGGGVIGLCWFTLFDLDVMLSRGREKKAAVVAVAVGRRNSFGATNVGEVNLERAQSAADVTTGLFMSSPPSPSLSPSGSVVQASDGENLWLELEPSGQLSLKVNFIPDLEKVKKNFANIVRSKPVQKVFQKKGHKFVATKFYPVMKCAVCTEFLVSSQGYQCQGCKYTCHKKCQSRVPIKCITLSKAEQGSERDDDQLLRHRIPHRFEETLNLAATWCCHCGYMLPISKKECKKCSECGVSAHTNCALLVPNLCGMTPQMMEQMRLAIELAERNKREKEIMVAEQARAIALQDHEKPLESSSFTNPPDAVSLPTYAPANVTASLAVAAPSPKASVATPQKKVKPRPVGLDDFTFLAVLGKGNFGKVMLAEEKLTGKHYAIKVLKKDFIIESDEVEATRSEKRVFLTANIERFPFLVNLHSCFQTESRLYFVMEYVSGGDLMWHIQQRAFTAERAKYYACEVLLALEYFHKNNIIYRDLKLDNILLTLDGHVKIADYGLCKENMPFGARTTTFCGTPEFMSPEILLEKPYTRSVDWWSFGVLIYELLLGQAPFKGEDEDQIFDSILHKEVQFPSKIDPKAADVIRRLLTKDPGTRLGNGPLDADEIKAHPFFSDVNWADVLHKRNPPPFVPSITSATDVSNFDEEFTKEMPVLTPCKTTLASADQEEFRGFTYVSEWAQVARPSV